MNTATTKVCSKCGEELPLSQFSKTGKTAEGVQKYQYYCKACFAAYYKANAAAIKEQQKAYYKDNKEKRKAYYKDNKEAIAKKQKAYRKANAEAIAEQKKVYYKANAEAIAEQKKVYYKANAEAIAEKKKGYDKANPLVKFKSHSKQRNAPIVITGNADFDELNEFCIEEMLHHRNLLTEMTAIRHEIDHIVPVAQGGKTVWFNLRVVPASENKQKNAQHIPLPTSPDYSALTIKRTI